MITTRQRKYFFLIKIRGQYFVCAHEKQPFFKTGHWFFCRTLIESHSLQNKRIQSIIHKILLRFFTFCRDIHQ